MSMSMVDSRPVASASERQRRNVRLLAYVAGILAVLVAAVTVMAIKDGASGALLTVVCVVAIAGTVLGIWGTSMAVKETQDFGSRSSG